MTNISALKCIIWIVSTIRKTEFFYFTLSTTDDGFYFILLSQALIINDC